MDKTLIPQMHGSSTVYDTSSEKTTGKPKTELKKAGIAPIVFKQNTVAEITVGQFFTLPPWQERSGTSWMAEGFNNKIRRAYGFRDREYFKLKIHQLPEISCGKTLCVMS